MSSTTPIHLPETLPYPIKVLSLAVRASESIQPGKRLLNYSFLYIPGGAIDQAETRYGSWESTFEGELKSWSVKVGDMVTRQRAAKPVLHIVEPCSHGMQINGLCALCGMDMENFDYTGRAESSRATIQMTHSASGPTVSLEEAQRIERETAEHLLKSRKLSLIVDLDQTIVHATVDPTVGEWIAEGEAWEVRRAGKKQNGDLVNGDVRVAEGGEDSGEGTDEEDEVNPNWEALKDVKKFRLAPEAFSTSKTRWSAKDKGKEKSIQNEGCLYYVKPRPGWKEFLSSVAEKYEMHVYTMGTRAYAEEVCAAIDPEGRLFGGRILSRDESGSLTQKSLQRLFPCDTSMVVIIDDRADVWEWSPNLVKVIPYDFFVGIGDINSTFLPKVDPLGPLSVPQNPSADKDQVSSTNEAAASTTPAVPSSPSTEAAADTLGEESEAKKEMITQNTIALEAQLEERPLAKQQELLETDEADDANIPPAASEAAATQNGTGSSEADHAHRSRHHRKALLKNDDDELKRVGWLLDEVHKRFFDAYDNRLPGSTSQKKRRTSLTESPTDEHAYDVKRIIPSLRADTFAGIHVLFSGVIPTSPKVEHETTEIWKMARTFGATCHKDLSPEVTHVVASKSGTQKVEKAKAMGKTVVWLSWFTDSVAQWRRQDERHYLISDKRASSPSAPTASSPPSDPNAISTDTDPEELIGEAEADADREVNAGGEKSDEVEASLLQDAEAASLEIDASDDPLATGEVGPDVNLDLGDVNWDDVNDEVDAAMMESDSEDEGDGQSLASGRSSSKSSEDGSMAEDGASTSSANHSSVRRRKRLRSVTPTDHGNASEASADDDALRSPLAKRKKLAADRSGASRLKQAISAQDLDEDEDEDGEERRSGNPGTPSRVADVDMDEEGEDEEGDGDEGEDEFGFDDDFLARELEEELDEG